MHKIHNKWDPFYIVIEKLSEVTYKISSEFTGKIVTCHKNKIRLALVVDWEKVCTDHSDMLNRQEIPGRRVMPYRMAKQTLPSISE